MVFLLYKHPNMTKIVRILLIVLLTSLQATAQTKVKVAIFAPLYIDSLFDGTNYKLGNANFPKYVLPGLEFYNGALLAIDSLKTAGKEIDFLIVDTKSTVPIQTTLQSEAFSKVSMMIAAFTNRTEAKLLATVAYERQIPLVSATYPNDAGITNNPFFILVNSSLKTHCEGIYKYLQRNHAVGDNIVYIKGKGAIEDMIEGYFKESARFTASIPVKWQTLPLTDSFTAAQLCSKLDSTKNNVLVCGDVHENFGIKLVRTLAAQKSFRCTAIGMPTWDGLKELDKPEYKSVEIVYSTPYNYPRSVPISKALAQAYHTQWNARPSDMVFKGYEMTLRFAQILLDHGTKTLNHLSDNNYKLFNEFDFQTVKNAFNKSQIDYLENKKLYFIKK